MVTMTTLASVSYSFYFLGDDVIGISVKVRGSEHTVFQVWNQTIQARDQSKVT